MENLESIKTMYESMDLNDTQLKEEYLLVCQFLKDKTEKNDDPLWTNLGDDEKQLKRIQTLKSAKKILNQSNADMFRVEESVMDLYEALNACLSKLESTFSDEQSSIVKRLKAILYIEKNAINRYRDPKKIETLNFKVLKRLIYDCINSSLQDFFVKESGLLFFESKLEITQRLLFKK